MPPWRLGREDGGDGLFGATRSCEPSPGAAQCLWDCAESRTASPAQCFYSCWLILRRSAGGAACACNLVPHRPTFDSYRSACGAFGVALRASLSLLGSLLPRSY